MVKKAISQMKTGKAPGPSGINMETVQAVCDTGASMIRDLTAAIIRDGQIPPTGSRVSLFVCTRVSGMHSTGATIVISS